MDEDNIPTTDAQPAESPAKAKSAPKINKKTAVIGAAVGIGSAAIVAALLYANRGNGKS
ncbi:hypothetical protein [Rhizorhabdus sp.]|uniref:hypothetical protein n=1 Tax=Rhizorhabdus sp. TaxID=1968843 RepID=UPI001B3F6DBC|nr:hypothetical protein [Rhizorhabdus sp.]MBP8235718.1 hypothetical protein [Rhizorhabdus sp.]